LGDNGELPDTDQPVDAAATYIATFEASTTFTAQVTRRLRLRIFVLTG